MAKRKRLEAPDAKTLKEMEEGFATKPVPEQLGITAPIAHVAGEAAEDREAGDVGARVAAAESERAAKSWREAVAEGRVIQHIRVGDIELNHLVRDRTAVGFEEIEELKESIKANGIRTPVEVAPLAVGYGLISGWRRIVALQALNAEDIVADDRVPAIIRAADDAGAAYVAMVEENEIRAELTPYERGRIAVVAVGQGAFTGVGEAVSMIYAAASKAKRSKIRSFALVHEELGDLLAFPLEISEKAGLRLAAALRAGFGAKLREALASGLGTDAASEWGLLQPILADAEATANASRRGGRPSSSRPRRLMSGDGVTELANGITMERVPESDGYSIRLRGKVVDAEMVDTVIREIERLLDPA